MIAFIHCALLIIYLASPALSDFVSNLDVACLKCLCHASTNCNERFDCSKEGFCGPFFISKKYWEDAGRISLRSDVYSSDGRFKECVKNFQCAAKVVTSYMAENAWDCNNDGVTNCDDYARIHFRGPDRCDKSIENTEFHKRYLTCRPPKAEDDFYALNN